MPGSINLGHVVGPTGPQGATGPTGPQGVQGSVGPGVPTGGTTGQVLRKTDGTNYNTEWHSLDDADIPSSVDGKANVKAVLSYHSQQIDDLQDESDTRVLKPSAAFSIPASGGSVSYNLAGLTANHELARWNFSSSAENDPPVDLSWYTYDGYFTITNTSGSTSETIQPVFVLPEVIATTVHS